MDTNPYVLTILNQKTGNSYKKFFVGGFETIGVDELEPFMISFKNNTNERIQVRLSVDGTDVLTSKPASTSNKGDMFLVEPYGRVELKAWPEDTNGGAQFLFTPAKDGVALNTHGNTSSKGIIAAAVFVEGSLKPQTVVVEKTFIEKIKELRTLTNLGLKDSKDLLEFSKGDLNKAWETYKTVKTMTDQYAMTDILRDFIGAEKVRRSNTKLLLDSRNTKGVTRDEYKGIAMHDCHVDSDDMPSYGGPCGAAAAASAASEDICERAIDMNLRSERLDYCNERMGFMPDSRDVGTLSRGLVGPLRSKNLAVGAGERVDQIIKRATSGLIFPVNKTIVQVKYMPWTDLRPRIRLETNTLSYAHPGFPGDAEQLCNIRNTPRYEERPYGVVRRVREEVVKKFEDISRFD